MAETRATFTTLHAEGKLRGCCGTLEASQPLARDVVHSAFQAAFHDPRFDPVGKDELAAIIDAAIAETGAESMRDMGKVMSKVKAAAAGRADMARVSATIKARLAG